MALTDNLVSVYECEEASGNITDALGTNTLTDTLSVGSATGKVGNARTFDGAVQYGIKVSATFPNGASQSATVAAWVKLDTVTPGQVIIGKHTSAGSLRQWLTQFDGATSHFINVINAQGDGSDVSVAEALVAISTGTWYYVVGRYDATADLNKISVNAGTVYTAAHTGGIANTAAALYMGNYGNLDAYLDGTIDQVLIYSRSISDAEVTELYNSGNGLSYAAMSGGGAVGRYTGQGQLVSSKRGKLAIHP